MSGGGRRLSNKRLERPGTDPHRDVANSSAARSAAGR